MNRRELIRTVSKRANIPEKEARQVIDTFLSVVADTAKKGDKVVIQKFGTFRVVTLKGKTARNPKTGEKIKVPTYRTLRFKPCLELKIL